MRDLTDGAAGDGRPVPRAAAAVSGLFAAVLVAATAPGCDGRSYDIDPFPIPVDMDGGVPVALVSAPELGGTVRRAVIDTGSALSAIDTNADSVTRQRLSITLLAPGAAGPVPRARFRSVIALIAPLAAGTGVLGGDVLSRVAVRFDLSRSQILLFPDIAATGDDLARSCDAVFRTGIAGGGRFQLDQGTYAFSATRMVVGACAEREGPAGRANLLLVLATGIAPMVLSENAFARMTGGVDPTQLPAGQVVFPGALAPTPARLGSVSGVTLTLATDEADRRDACCEVCASRQAAGEACAPDLACPAPPDVPVLPAAAVVGLEGPFAVAVVADEALDGLRAELAPDVAIVDGLLGADLIRRLVVDVDYPNGRLVFHCARARAAAGLTCRPRIGPEQIALLTSAGCLDPPLDAAPPPDAPTPPPDAPSPPPDAPAAPDGPVPDAAPPPDGPIP